ncbi:MAG: ATP-dependent helicase [Acidiferrobacterales bacterium]
MKTQSGRDLFAGLNPEQVQAVRHIDGPLMILAGAGAGKTTVMTRRAARLIQLGHAPSRIMLVTFTNKAAREMKQRVAALLEESAGQPVAGTFHSIVLQHILLPAHRAGLLAQFGFTKTPTILDARDSDALWRSAWKAIPMSDRYRFSAAGMELKHSKRLVGLLRARGLSVPPDIDPGRVVGRSAEEQRLLRHLVHELSVRRCHEPDVIASALLDLWEKYHASCLALNAMDFDNMLVLGASVLDGHPEFAGRIAGKFSFIEADEFQDTNPVQNRILEILAAPHGNLAVCGDDRQSIYGFRGSDISVIREFRQRHPQAKIIDLVRNYRSTSSIVDAANGCARAMPNRLSGADMISDTHAHVAEPPSCRTYASDVQEGEDVCAQIEQANAAGEPWSSLAVLYRSRAIKRKFEGMLVNHRIPFVVVGDIGFFEHRDVADTMGLVRALFDRDELLGWKRILAAGGFGITPAMLEKKTLRGASAWDTLLDLARTRKEKALKLRSLMTQVDRFSQQRNAPQLDIRALTYEVVLEDRAPETFPEYLVALWRQYLLPHLRADKEKEIAKKYQTRHGFGSKKEALLEDYIRECHERIGTVANLVAMVRNETPDWNAVLNELTLQTDVTEADKHRDAVRLMTVHAAKGLEFDRIWYLGGADENPAETSRRTPAEDEEERRIFYVAITRPRRALIITGARTRWYDKIERSRLPSQFYAEVRRFVPPSAAGEPFVPEEDGANEFGGSFIG